jgi:predicted enzyme related to lactoylglutathione lyase
MDDRTPHNPVEIATWLESVRQASVDETGLMKTQTAEEAESGVDISRLRANLRLTAEERLARMVAAATFFASIRGTVRRRHSPWPSERGGRGKGDMMLRGLTTISFYASDLDAAKRWYTELLGIEPYFAVKGTDGRPAYIEFRIGDYQHELGVIDSRYAPAGSATGPGGAIVYWHVDDVTATLEKLLSMGAQEHQAPIDRGEGFITASVVDPFGNILGIMYNPHYLDVLNESRR